MKRILVTGAAGFIGSYLVKALVAGGNKVVGIDNLNDYYDVNLKYGRLKELCGIEREDIKERELCTSRLYPEYRFVWGDITDRELLPALFEAEQFDIVCNLAAQAGVRYSLINPYAYAESNLMGFLNILEACRHHQVKHLVYASSSSVYGMNEKVPFSETDRTDAPVSLYAATKKSNELMAHTYSHLYRIPVTGLRFFTVYGPWGRPDMAPFLFMHSVTKGEPIRVFNHGQMRRDFTYIDDIIQAVVRVIEGEPKELYKIYNIGHSKPVELMDFIRCIEKATGKEAVCRYEGMQPGDVVCTYADTTELEHDFQYLPTTDIQTGVDREYAWYQRYLAE
ncbi:NAD-dependent epimerase/dehydratase family protein [Phocaeicola sp.]